MFIIVVTLAGLIMLFLLFRESKDLVNNYFHNKFPPGENKRLVFLEHSVHWLLIGGDLDIIKTELFQWCESID